MAIRKLQGAKRNIPFSQEKLKRRAELLYQKNYIRLLKEKGVNKLKIDKQREVAQIKESNKVEIEEAKEFLA